MTAMMTQRTLCAVCWLFANNIIFSTRNNSVYDPVYTDSLRPNNVHLHTVFTSPNQMLTLISVTPFWAVALKLVRYVKWDPGDICALLRNGTIESKVTWTAEVLEAWLHKQCWSMGYATYDTAKVLEMRRRIQHAVMMVNAWNQVDPIATQPSKASLIPGSTPNLSSSTHSSNGIPSSSAPEGKSMGGWGSSPANQSPGGAWNSPYTTSAIPPPPVVSPPAPWSAQSPPQTRGWHPSQVPAGHQRDESRDSFVGGFAILQPPNGQNAPEVVLPPAQYLDAPQEPRDVIHPLDLSRQFSPSHSHRKTSRLRRQASAALLSAPSWHEEAKTHSADDLLLHAPHNDPPVIPGFERLSVSETRHSRKKSKSLPVPKSRESTRYIPPGFVATGGEVQTTQWEWHGLSDAERQHVQLERGVWHTESLGRDVVSDQAIPLPVQDSTQPLQRPLRYQTDYQRSQTDSPLRHLDHERAESSSWHNGGGELTRTPPPLTPEDEERLWQPYHQRHHQDHGRGGQGTSLRQTQSLSVW
ncbi:hypothetical protein HGRIS_011012 [Hohenbuehelia grisea]|uniref:Uncharacterized protein n=1 Tax=Hohenbuehelia grisea TaxID=104357 RepID=A0ABR3IZ00_9AGAR